MFLMLIESQEDLLKVERLYYEHYKAMYIRANQILHSQELSEEALQESFIKVIKNLHKIDESKFNQTRAFLLVICTNVAKNIIKAKYKKENKQELLDEQPIADLSVDVENLVICRDTLGKTAQILGKLDPIYRDVILLKRLYDLSREEISSLLGISVETVKKRLTRAKAKIAQSLEEGETEQ